MRGSVSSSEEVRGIVERKPEVSEVCICEKLRALQVVEESSVRFDSEVVSSLRWPKQPPEPTLGLVTSRALGFFESMPSRKARLAPSPSAAHL
jgi:hypothetical protein